MWMLTRRKGSVCGESVTVRGGTRHLSRRKGGLNAQEPAIGGGLQRRLLRAGNNAYISLRRYQCRTISTESDEELLECNCWTDADGIKLTAFLFKLDRFACSTVDLQWGFSKLKCLSCNRWMHSSYTWPPRAQVLWYLQQCGPRSCGVTFTGT